MLEVVAPAGAGCGPDVFRSRQAGFSLGLAWCESPAEFKCSLPA